MIGIITYLCTIIEDQTYFIHEITSSHKGNEDLYLWQKEAGRRSFIYQQLRLRVCIKKIKCKVIDNNASV